MVIFVPVVSVVALANGEPRTAQASRPEWFENKLIVQAFLDSKDVASLELRSTPGTATASLVVPFVPKGTTFRLNGKAWKSMPWLTEAQRRTGNYFELYSLLKRSSLNYGVPAADIRAFFPPWNNHIASTLLLKSKKWQVDMIKVTVE